MDNILTYARWLRRIKQVSNIDTFRKTIQQFSLLDLKAILSCNDFSSITFLKKKNDRSFRPFHNFILLGSQMERSNTRWFTNNFQIIHDQSWWYFNAFLEEVSRRKISWTKMGVFASDQISQYRWTRSAPNSLFPFRRHLSVTEKRY